MIWNVIDRRQRPYRWKRINAIVEDVAHDNSCDDSDQAPGDDVNSVTYLQREAVSVEDAVNWAQQMAGAVTLFLYDQGAGHDLNRGRGAVPQTAHFDVVGIDRF